MSAGPPERRDMHAIATEGGLAMKRALMGDGPEDENDLWKWLTSSADDAPLSHLKMMLTFNGIAWALRVIRKRLVALEEKPHVSFRGVHDAEKAYAEGDAVTRQGGLWISLQPENRNTPGLSPGWTLAVKRSNAMWAEVDDRLRGWRRSFMSTNLHQELDAIGDRFVEKVERMITSALVAHEWRLITIDGYQPESAALRYEMLRARDEFVEALAESFRALADDDD